MRIFGAILAFLVIFLIMLFGVNEWFNGMGAILVLFSFAVSAILVAISFGIIDIFLAGEEEEHDIEH